MSNVEVYQQEPHHETFYDRFARNVVYQTIARISMILVAAMFIPATGVAGWIGLRIVNTIDKMSDRIDKVVEAQQLQNTAVSAVASKQQMMELRDMQLDNRITETNGTINLRIDDLSKRQQRDADDIDKLKEKVYPLIRTR